MSGVELIGEWRPTHTMLVHFETLLLLINFSKKLYSDEFN